MNMRNYQKSSDVIVKSCVELRQNLEHGSTLEVVFETKGIEYITAGNLAIYAENCPQHVEKFAKLMGYDLDMQFSLQPNEAFTGRKASMNIPKGSYTVREALMKFVSLTGPLTKKVVKELAQKCEDA